MLFSHKDLALLVDIVLQKASFVWSLIAVVAEISFSSDVNCFGHDLWPHSHFPICIWNNILLPEGSLLNKFTF